jgi:hypothetical protein
VTPGHGGKLDRKWGAAIAALIAHPTIPAAAQAVTVSEKTLDRWLKDPAFARRYREARQGLFQHGIGRACGMNAKAWDVVAALLDSADQAIRLKAALAVLDRTSTMSAVADLQSDVEELKRRAGMVEN